MFHVKQLLSISCEKERETLIQLNDDLADNPEFLQDYAYILREFGYIDRAKDVAKRYLTMVPDDVNMVEFLNEDEFDDDEFSEEGFYLF